MNARRNPKVLRLLLALLHLATLKIWLETCSENEKTAGVTSSSSRRKSPPLRLTDAQRDPHAGWYICSCALSRHGWSRVHQVVSGWWWVSIGLVTRRPHNAAFEYQHGRKRFQASCRSTTLSSRTTRPQPPHWTPTSKHPARLKRISFGSTPAYTSSLDAKIMPVAAFRA